MLSLHRHAVKYRASGGGTTETRGRMAACSLTPMAALTRAAFRLAVWPASRAKSLPRAPITFPARTNAHSSQNASTSATSRGECVPRPSIVLPLSERPAGHSCSLPALLSFHESARDQSRDVGDAFERSDGGPSANELMRELDWLLDDAVAAVRGPKICELLPDYGEIERGRTSSTKTVPGRYGSPESHRLPDAGDWIPCTWKAISGAISAMSGGAPHSDITAMCLSPEFESCEVLIRAGVDVELPAMWRSRIQHRVPFQYLVAACHWRDFVVSVQPGVLIPRPETEQLVDLAAAAVEANPILAGHVWADLGTGSGAIAIGLAGVVVPGGGRVVGVDVSDVAVEVARGNVRRCGYEESIQVMQGNWFSPLHSLQGQLGGVVSNPPYIPAADLPSLQAEVSRHEPEMALNGGPGGGMTHLTTICEGAQVALMGGGFLALETNGGDQAAQVASLLEGMRGSPFENVTIVADLAGIPRHVTATKRQHFTPNTLS